MSWPSSRTGTADMVSFGALFLANPDLPTRLAAGGPFNTPDRATLLRRRRTRLHRLPHARRVKDTSTVAHDHRLPR